MNQTTSNPFADGRAREAKIADGLRALAKAHGVQFEEPLQIDSHGEFALVVQPPGYGEKLAALLTRHSPRTGIVSGAHLIASSCWCRLHHFDAEKMLAASAMPEEGAEIVPLTVANGVLTAGSAFKVTTRAGFKLAAHEFSGSDGCRHSIDSLFPCAVRSGPAFAPWGIPASSHLYSRTSDVEAASAFLCSEYAKQAAKVAGEMQARAQELIAQSQRLTT